jgi:hypothetical protein
VIDCLVNFIRIGDGYVVPDIDHHFDNAHAVEMYDTSTADSHLTFTVYHNLKEELNSGSNNRSLECIVFRQVECTPHFRDVTSTDTD